MIECDVVQSQRLKALGKGAHAPSFTTVELHLKEAVMPQSLGDQGGTGGNKV